MKIIKTVWSLCFLTLAIVNTNAQTPPAPSFKKYEQQIPGSTVTFTMMPIAAGKFAMGSDKDKNADSDEKPLHTVTLDAFWMGAREVTYDEYALFLTDEALSVNSDADAVTRPTVPYIDLTLNMGKEGGFPANSMKQYAALMYCKWLYEKTGVFYRLPTEAEWEYACRAGSKDMYPFGNDSAQLNNYAWYSGNSGNAYHKTGLKKPNAWGLYDMLGNVSEWVLDQYQEDFYKTTENKNPVAAAHALHPRIVRGGDYNDDATTLRSANRTMSDLIWNRRDPQIPKSKWWNADAPFVGFRIIRPAVQPSKEQITTFYKSFMEF